jgi:hypothetical protein
MTLCTITGRIVAPDGTALPGASVTFVPLPLEVAPAANDTRAPASVQTVADGSGDVSVSLLPGQYHVRIRGADGAAYPTATVTVPDASVAILAQILDLPPPPTLDAAQQAVLAAQSARDVANAHKVAAQAAQAAAEAAETGAETAEAGALAAQGLAEAARDAAQASEGAAAGSAAAALASEQAAAASEIAASDSASAASGSASAASGSASAASGSAAAALASEQAAAASEIAAGASETAAEAARDKAAEWADKAEDTPVETGPDRFSAKHWAAKAADEAAPVLAALGNIDTILDGINGEVI